MPRRQAQDIGYQTKIKGDWNTIKILIPYLWPKDAMKMRMRVILAIGCLLIAKLATTIVPVLYKEAVDIISQSGRLFDIGSTIFRTL